MARLWYGPAGKPIEFRGPIEGAPGYLASMGLDAMEYEAVRGVRISRDKAARLGEEARRHGVVLSMHAPYFVNLSSPDRSVVLRSIERLHQAMVAAEWMGCTVVVVHSGYLKGNRSREEALGRVIEAYEQLLESLPAYVKTPYISPETMGKTSQVGNLEEVVRICSSIDRCKPTVDWAHIYAYSEGSYVLTVDHVIESIEFIERELGSRAVRPLHTHFSKIKYGRGGEREHRSLGEEGYGPEWSIVCRGYLETGVDGVIISESPVLDRDSLVMKRVCEEESKKLRSGRAHS